MDKPKIVIAGANHSQYEAMLVVGASMINISNGKTYAAREFYEEPETHQLPRTDREQDIYEMLAVQTGRNRRQIKDIMFPRVYGLNPVFYTDAVVQLPADQIKGPKGPRGKWGKLT